MMIDKNINANSYPLRAIDYEQLHARGVGAEMRDLRSDVSWQAKRLNLSPGELKMICGRYGWDRRSRADIESLLDFLLQLIADKVAQPLDECQRL